jgi:formate hydrogenlyase transcriptional activator
MRPQGTRIATTIAAARATTANNVETIPTRPSAASFACAMAAPFRSPWRRPTTTARPATHSGRRRASAATSPPRALLQGETALPPTLVESELFGHEKGAFTGAIGQRKGRFEIADGSTLFLDEVGELPLELQAKLLPVIQDGEFERVGGTATLKVDVRLVAATNRRLEEEEVKGGRFRQDLWYRLNVFPITVPPLRQRREDIPLLVRHFVEKHCRRMGRTPLEVSVATLKDLAEEEWRGNIRELESVIERAVISSPGTALRVGDLGERPARSEGPGAPGRPDTRTLEENERDHIVVTLERTSWRVAGEGGAAALLGINPSTLRSRMLKLGIVRPGAAPPPPRAGA